MPVENAYGCECLHISRGLHEGLHMYPYQVHTAQQLKPDNKPTRREFATKILDCINTDSDFLGKVLFSDEATFHLSGYVCHHNVRI
ncbi:hypothetical protein GDO78_021414 [Eleutherodactylus coqui]|uniref:Uncharacterized protein n=1 Tax=Eleutherodactylus coqui TaxID=57060 RepID=A0A8J6BBG6_ELECQ|nr:hypothetical protein GDO78_021414 [Eleutherodactylus coqui]